MKHRTLLSSVLVLFASAALAQSADRQISNDIPSEVAAARCRYAPADEVCATLGESSETQRTDNATVAQFPRRAPGPPMRRPRMGRPRPAYPTMWRPEVSGRHALIGALIGGGLATAVAVKGNGGVRASFALGTLGAGIGAAIGLSIPSFPYPNPYRRRWPDQGWPDEDESASQIKPESAKPDASHQTALRSAAPQPAATREDRATSAGVP
jgi:predicted lipid-binding transport protein (Tim44 family)